MWSSPTILSDTLFKVVFGLWNCGGLCGKEKEEGEIK